MDTMFDRAERGLGSTNFSVPDIVARTKGNPSEIMKMVAAGQINVTQGLLAKRLSDSVIAERSKAMAAGPSVLQESFPEMAQMTGGLGAPPQTAPQAAPLSQPAPVPNQMEGGLGAAPIPEGMFAGGEVGGLGSYAEGDMVEPENALFSPDEVDVNSMMALLNQQAPRELSAFNAYRDRVSAAPDAQQGRKEAEKLALFSALGNVRPGTNPIQAFVQGLSSTGQSLVQNEKEQRKQELEGLRAAAEIEGKQNEFSRQDFALAIQLKQYKEGRLDKAEENRLRKVLQDDQIAAQRALTLLEIGSRERIAGMQEAGANRRAAISASSGGGGGGGALKISTVRPVFDALRKEAIERVKKTPAGLKLSFGKNPREIANYNDRVALTTAELARNRYGTAYPELAASVIELSGGIGTLDRLDAAKSKKSTSAAPGGSAVVDFNSLK